MSPRCAPVLAGAVVVLVVSAVMAPVTPAAAATATCSAFFDADGNGTDDLAIGTPGEDVLPSGTLSDAGTVTIVHGDAAGVFGSSGSTLVTEENLGLVSQAGDRFGAAVATADLNGDGCGDLAVGIPGKRAKVGAVVVVWGSVSGLDLAHPQLLAQGSAPVGSTAEAGDGFGSTLAVAGSLPTGGAASLWVGSPGEDVGTIKDAGMVSEIKATAGGLLGAAGVAHVYQDLPGVPGHSEPGGRFGDRLSGGGRTLLVGVPHEDVGSLPDAGAVYAVGITGATRTWTRYTQDSPGVGGAAEANDWFGSSVAQGAGCAGPVDETWAIGASGEDVGTIVNTGTVTLRDRANGRSNVIRQGAQGIPDPAEAADVFGTSLVDAGGVLVVGSPGEDVGTIADAGAVSLVELDCRGGVAVPGLSLTWSQSSADVAGASETGDRFGATLGASLVGTSGPGLQVRLTVGSPGEAEGSIAGSGNVTVFGTDPGGRLTATRSVALGQATTGIVGDPQAGDGFGGALDASNASVL